MNDLSGGLHSDLPIIRVQIDGIRKSLLHALTQESGQMEAAIREVFANFNFKAEVQAEVRRVLPELVRNMTKRAVESSLYTLREELQPVVDATVRNAAKNLSKGCGCLTGCKSPDCDK